MRAFFCLLLFSQIAAAHVRYVVDVDGTFIADQGPHAAWRTDWILLRTDKRHSGLQPNPSAPIELYIPNANGGVDATPVQHPDLLRVTYGDFRRLRPFLATEDRLLGRLDPRKPFQLSRDPLGSNSQQPEWILPGLYQVYSGTYDRFQTIGRSFVVHPLKEDSENAFRRVELTAQTSRLRIEGPAFHLVQAALSNQAKPNRLSFFTARGHSQSEFMSYFFDPMFEHRMFRNNPRDMGVTLHALGDPSNLSKFGNGSLETLKVNAVRLEALQLLLTPVSPHLELDSAPREAALGKKVLRKTLLVAEDDPIHVQNVGALLTELSMRPEFKNALKLVLFQAGTEEDFNRRWPYRWVVFHDGRGRPAEPSEIAIWESGEEPEPSCESLISQTIGVER